MFPSGAGGRAAAGGRHRTRPEAGSRARHAARGLPAPVLVACGDRRERDILGRALSRRGYPVRLLADGPRVLAAADEQRPAAVVVDLLTPGCCGRQVCSRLKARPGWWQVPVLLIVARGDRAQIVEGFRAGADEVVTRPFDPGELVRLVARRAVRADGERDRT